MKLTDSQLVILSAAAKRSDGSVLPLPKSVKLNKGATTLVLKSLLKHKLVAEEFAERESEAWREGGDGQRFALSITPAGMKAIGVEEAPDTKASGPSSKWDSRKARPTDGPAASAPSKKSKTAVREGTKLSALIALLSRKSGATLEEAAKVTGWQHHSIRGAMSGALKKKMGLKIDSSVSGDRGRVYRIEGGK
ncbi:MAG: DUF3489 domain-containing protein [Acidobacteria bacterium]|nr:DUF3489 domain-containing protein [Acidobacteriota bacterium]